MVVADVAGQFQTTNLSPGRYSICAFGNGPLQLTGCGWIPTGVVHLAAGQSVTGLDRRVLDGRLITIRVTEAASKIRLPDSNGRITEWERRFHVGLLEAGGMFAAATFKQPLGQQRIFEVIVPKGRELELFIDTSFAVTDQNGVPLTTRRPSGKRLLTGNTNEPYNVDLVVQ